MLQFITHTNTRFNYIESALQALTGGCKWIQLRMKDAPTAEIKKAALYLQPVCKKYGATFILDDRIDLVIETGADGVHLGKNDTPVDIAREILGDKYIIGGTANTFEDIERLTAAKVDYIGLGPFRYTETKKNLSPILGIEGYRHIITRCKEKNITTPIVAIGGITRNDIPELYATGIHGIALSGTILNADNPSEETRNIIQLMDKQNNMKKIILNHQELLIENTLTLAGLLEEKKLNGSGVAAAINNRVIPRKEWDTTLLNENDKITVIRATCGG